VSPVPLQAVAHRAVEDMDRRKAFDDNAVLVVDHAGLGEVELVDLDLGAGVGKQAEPRLGVPDQRLHLLFHEMLSAVSRLGAGRAVQHQRLDPAAGPAPDPDLGEIADMIGVQMGGEIGGDVLVRNFQRSEVRLRAGPEIHDEIVAISQLDQPRAVRLTAPHERTAGAERGDAHLAGREGFCVGIEIIAQAGHDRSARPTKFRARSGKKLALKRDGLLVRGRSEYRAWQWPPFRRTHPRIPQNPHLPPG
jgi:hypothetical protein